MHKPADFAGHGNSQAARSGENRGADVDLRPAPVILQPVAASQDGGSSELAMGAPSPATASDDSVPVEELAAGNAAQQLSEIRPESGVGLFCDIEVSAPSLPIGGSVSAAIPSGDVGFSPAAAGIREGKSSATTELVPSFIAWWQAGRAGVADHLPLLLGVTVLVCQGGFRLEEKIPPRERRVRWREDR